MQKAISSFLKSPHTLMLILLSQSLFILWHLLSINYCPVCHWIFLNDRMLFCVLLSPLPSPLQKSALGRIFLISPSACNSVMLTVNHYWLVAMDPYPHQYIRGEEVLHTTAKIHVTIESTWSNMPALKRSIYILIITYMTSLSWVMTTLKSRWHLLGHLTLRVQSLISY